LIDLRAEVRKAQNYTLSDLIRKRLGEIGIQLDDRDRAGVTSWRLGPRTFSVGVGEQLKLQMPAKQLIVHAQLTKDKVADVTIDPGDQTTVSIIGRTKGASKLTLKSQDGTTEELQIVI